MSDDETIRPPCLQVLGAEDNPTWGVSLTGKVKPSPQAFVPCETAEAALKLVGALEPREGEEVVQVVFAGEGPSLEFVEVEGLDGRSIGRGRWAVRGDGRRVLFLRLPADAMVLGPAT